MGNGWIHMSFVLTNCNKLQDIYGKIREEDCFIFQKIILENHQYSIRDSITTNWVQFGNLNVKLRRLFEVSNSFTFEAPEFCRSDLNYSGRKSLINLSNLDGKWNLDRSQWKQSATENQLRKISSTRPNKRQHQLITSAGGIVSLDFQD